MAIVGVALLGVVLVHTSRTPAAAPARNASVPPAVPVSVATASRTDLPVRLTALGSVVAFNTVTVRPRVDGQLMRVLFQEGQFVQEGELLAEIDPRPFQVQLEQAEGQLARDQAQLANADSRITAPLSGRVGLRLVDVGNVVSASATTGLVVITQVDPIAVVFTLPEDALSRVLPRIRAGVRLPVDAFDRSGATRLATGSVVTVDNQIDQSTGTVRLKAVFDNRDHALFPSQFVNVQMLADTERAQLLVPAAAVQQGPQGQFVYLVRDGKAVVQGVQVAEVEAERASIRSGLSAGDVVVTDGIDRLREGSRVEVRQ